MKNEYKKHLPKNRILIPSLNAKREYLFAKRYDAPRDVLDKLFEKWKKLENDK
jgi:hypothetical protein